MFKSLLMLLALGVYELFRLIKRYAWFLVLVLVAWAAWHYRWLAAPIAYIHQCHYSGSSVVMTLFAGIGCGVIGLLFGAMIGIGMKK